MARPNDGGPAFPATLQAGMSLRDYFAGQALAGIMASPRLVNVIADMPSDPATFAYSMADAMLKARLQNED